MDGLPHPTKRRRPLDVIATALGGGLGSLRGHRELLQWTKEEGFDAQCVPHSTYDVTASPATDPFWFPYGECAKSRKAQQLATDRPLRPNSPAARLCPP